jgi:hypothetical protein
MWWADLTAVALPRTVVACCCARLIGGSACWIDWLAASPTTVLTGTQHAKAQCTTIRLMLLKTGARIRITVRKVWLSFSEACPYASDFAQILANLRRHPAWAPPGQFATLCRLLLVGISAGKGSLASRSAATVLTCDPSCNIVAQDPRQCPAWLKRYPTRLPGSAKGPP